MSATRYIYVASAVLHAAIGGAMASVRPKPVRERVTITMRAAPPPRPAEATPPPPPPPPPPAAESAPTPAPPRQHAPRPSRARPAPAPANAAPAPSSGDAPPDFGLTLGGDGPGLAVPQGGGGGAERPRDDAPRPAQPRPRADHDECTEEASRPRVVEMPSPEYTDEARDQGIEGRVRVEISVDATGAVRGVRVLQGLGHGLDEAALEAARGARFEPATRCGRAVATTFTVGIRFAL